MRQEKTHELRVSFTADKAGLAIKEQVKAWLIERGVNSFVEGVVDSLDIDHEYGLGEASELFDKLGGDTSPISVYKYNREPLEDLRLGLSREFEKSVVCSMHVMDTKEWLDGWKDSFKPFTTRHFYVYPPWESNNAPAGTIPLSIEPAAAFGTGQHATTRLCMGQLESIADEWKAAGRSLGATSVLDVGTGTGILAIGARLLGFGTILASDIDDDAVSATRDNARLNQIEIPVIKGSVPTLAQGERPYDLVMANILAVVLAPLLPELAEATAPNSGRLVLSGILAEESETMIRHAERAGLRLLHQDILEHWTSLTFAK